MKKFFKHLIKTILILLVLTIVFLGVFIQEPITVFGSNKISDHKNFFRDTASRDVTFVDRKLTEIKMLGSHDALSNDITYSSNSNVNEDNITNNAVVRTLAKGLIVRLSRAQNNDIYEQLIGGVRYIDVRLTYIDGVYYNCHGLISGKMDENLIKIIKFLSENPGEFILFHIVHFYTGESSFEAFAEHLATVKYESKSLLDFVNYSSSIHEFKDLTYGNITSNGTKAGAVLFSDDGNSTTIFHQLNKNKIYSKWHNKIVTKDILPCIEEASEQGAAYGNEYLRINQAQLTPNFVNVPNVIGSYSLLELAKKHNNKVLEMENFTTITNNLPILMVDFSTSDTKDFNNKAIKLLSELNENH